MSLKSSNKIGTNTYEIEVTISPEDFNAAVLNVFKRKRNGLI